MAIYSFSDDSDRKNSDKSSKSSRFNLLILIILILLLAVCFLLWKNLQQSAGQSQFTAVPAETEIDTAEDVEAVITAAPEDGDSAEVVEAADAAEEAVAGGAEATSETPVIEVSAAESVVEPVAEVIVVETVAEPVETVPAALAEALTKAREELDYRRYQAGHEALAALLADKETVSYPKFRNDVITELNFAAKKIAFGNGAHSDKITYMIDYGDNLDRIARRNNTTVEAIATLNGITDHNRIMLGYDLVILPGPWKVEVELASCEVFLYRNGSLFMVFIAGVGKDRLTPKGTFIIADRVIEPSWTVGNEEIPYGDPRNIIGSRWMPLKATGDTPRVDGIGIHGSTDNKSIGKSSSNGCVRLSNNDVEDLYALLPINSEVIIR